VQLPPLASFVALPDHASLFAWSHTETVTDRCPDLAQPNVENRVRVAALGRHLDEWPYW